MESVDERIAKVLAKRAGAVGPEVVTQGTEGLRPSTSEHNTANVPSARSKEQILAERSATTKHGPHSSSIVMRDSSMEPTVATSVLLGDLLVYVADTGAGYVEGAQRIFTQDADGKVTKDAVAVTKLIYAALKAGHTPSLPKASK